MFCVFRFEEAECTTGTWWAIKSLDLLQALASNFVRGTVRFYGAMNVNNSKVADRRETTGKTHLNDQREFIRSLNLKGWELVLRVQFAA